MNLTPARNALLLIICFVAVIGVVFAGAWFYKYSSESNIQIVDEQITEVEENQEAKSVSLSLVPTANSQEYQLILTGLTGHITTIAFQLLSADTSAPITATTIAVSPVLQQSGWTTVINNESSTETQQSVSFSLIRTGLSDDIFPSELTVGTIQLSSNVSLDAVQINPEESFITYLNAENPVRIILGTDSAVPAANK